MLAALNCQSIAYKRRKPEQELLFQVLLVHLETFLSQTRLEDFSLPRYVENELRDYLKCGVLSHGFVRVRCNDCGKSLAVGFSCKGRGFCPSCTGRRMADTSARLVDDTFPADVPVRQWVLSLPIQIRYRLAYDGKLLSDVLAVFLRVVQGWYRQQGRGLGVKDCQGGSVTFSQRFGSSLNLNPHFQKTPWRDGTTHLIFSPMELIEKLAALVPPPRVNLVRYHGILAPNAKCRAAVIPKKPDEKELEKTRGKSRNRLLWAALMARTFRLQMEVCEHCGGRMRVVAAISDTASIKTYLDGVGVSSTVPKPHPARPPPQTEIEYEEVYYHDGV